jgi:hypothetical protein
MQFILRALSIFLVRGMHTLSMVENVRKAIVIICKWRHIQCFTHTLSLAVKDAIHDNLEFSGIIFLQ